MLQQVHFEKGFGKDVTNEAIGSGLFKWLQALIAAVEKLGPAGVALATKTIADISAGNWIAIFADVMALIKMLQATPAGVPAP